MDGFQSVFREYDIRGRVSQEEINEESVASIAGAFSQYLEERGVSDVVVGYDSRSCSPSLAEAAIGRLARSGLTVYDIGLTLSPAAYFAQYHLQARGVMMVTASHNPNGWAGLKLGAGYASTLGRADIERLYALTQAKAPAAFKSPGKRIRRNVRDAYLANILSRVSVDRAQAPRIAVDAGNGGAGLFAYELFQALGCTTFQLNCDPDTSFPHYFPNPSDLRALARLREMVTHPYIKADMGFAFDGDGDRLGVMDSGGGSIWPDRVLMLLAAAFLETHKGAKVVFDVKCTQALIEVIEQLGGEPVMCKTGHSHVKAKMHEVGAVLAGERSGHIFFGGDTYLGFDDALFAGAKLVECVSRQGKRIEEALAFFPAYVTSPEISARCGDDRKYAVVEGITRALKKAYGGRVNDLNGARVQFDDGWGLVRASSNLPELVLVFEGASEEAMRRILLLFRQTMLKYPEVSPDWENVPAGLLGGEGKTANG